MSIKILMALVRPQDLPGIFIIEFFIVSFDVFRGFFIELVVLMQQEKALKKITVYLKIFVVADMGSLI